MLLSRFHPTTGVSRCRDHKAVFSSKSRLYYPGPHRVSGLTVPWFHAEYFFRSCHVLRISRACRFPFEAHDTGSDTRSVLVLGSPRALGCLHLPGFVSPDLICQVSWNPVRGKCHATSWQTVLQNEIPWCRALVTASLLIEMFLPWESPPCQRGAGGWLEGLSSLAPGSSSRMNGMLVPWCLEVFWQSESGPKARYCSFLGWAGLAGLGWGVWKAIKSSHVGPDFESGCTSQNVFRSILRTLFSQF